MKIRNGFVSNSSSSSFVIVVPDDVESIINIDELLKLCDKEYDLFDNTERLEIKNKIINYINDGCIYQYDDDLYDAIYTYFKDKKLILTSSDVSSDDGSMTFIKESEINEIMKNLKNN